MLTEDAGLRNHPWTIVYFPRKILRSNHGAQQEPHPPTKVPAQVPNVPLGMKKNRVGWKNWQLSFTLSPNEKRNLEGSQFINTAEGEKNKTKQKSVLKYGRRGRRRL